MADAMRYLTVDECALFGPPGSPNEVYPAKVDATGQVLEVWTFTGHASGWREHRIRPHGHRVYGRLVAAVDSGEVK